MIRLANAAKAWGTARFSATLKRELEQLPAGALPLQGALTMSSYVVEHGPIGAMVIDASEDAGKVRAKVGIFFTGILGGCACADDPTPVNENAEYCVLAVEIALPTGEAAFTLLNE